MKYTGYTVRRQDDLYFSGVKQAKWTANENHAKVYMEKKAVLQAVKHFEEEGMHCTIAIKRMWSDKKKPKHIKKTGFRFAEPATVYTVAAYIVLRLKAKGFIVFRYNAKSTNSVYLKLDHGVGKSIRISDHRGMSHLTYKYNVLSTCQEVYSATPERGTEQFFYGYTQEHVDSMIDRIVTMKNQQIDKYGKKSYERLMERNYQENSTRPGFWSMSWQA